MQTYNNFQYQLYLYYMKLQTSVDIQVHPFDLTYDQIGRHRKQYSCPKGGLKNAFPIPKATLEEIFRNLSNKIVMHESAWKEVLQEFDQSTFDINQNGEKADQGPDSSGRIKIYNTAEKSDMVLLASKIEFSDFLKAIQRESRLRDILSEHQLYFHSVQRLVYWQETRLVMKAALEAMNLARQQGGKPAKIPAVTYLVDNLVMFTFQGVTMLLIAFENKTVQMYDSSNGHFLHDFNFYDNVFDQFTNQQDLNEEDQKKLDEKKKLEEAELERAGMNKFEIRAFQRKIQRERGEYKPEIPPFTKVERPEKSVALRLTNKLSTIGRANNQPEMKQVNSFIQGTLGKMSVHTDGTMMSPEHAGKYLDQEDELLGKSGEFRVGGTVQSPQNNSPIDRFRQQMCDHTESSRRDEQDRYRRCCRQQSMALARGNGSKGNVDFSGKSGGTRNKTNLAKTIAFQKSRGGTSIESMASLLKGGQESVNSRHQRNAGTFLSNKNVLISLQTSSPLGRDEDIQMKDIPEDGGSDFNSSMNQKSLFNKSIKLNRNGGDSALMKSQTIDRQQVEPNELKERLAKAKKEPQKGRGAGADPQIMNQFAYKLGGKVSNEFDTVVRKETKKDLKQLDKYERENKEKIRNNIDEAMEEKLLQEAVFSSAKMPKEAFSPVGMRPKKERSNLALKGTRTRQSAVAKAATRTLKEESEEQNDTRLQAATRIRNDKRKAAQEEREILRNQRNNKVKMTMYGVLGLDSIIPKDVESNVIQDKKSGGNEHSYGLDHKLFMSSQVRDKAEDDYKKMIQALDSKISQGRKQIKFKQDLELTAKSTSVGKKKQSSVPYGEAKPHSVKWIIEHPEELAAYIKKMKDDKNQLKLLVEELGERQGVFGGWLSDFNKLCAIKIKTDGKLSEEEKAEGQHKKDEQEKKKELDLQEKEEQKKPHLLKIRDEMIKEKRQRMEVYQFNIQDIIDDRGKKKAKESKPTYPMCMEYYEPYNIAIFALVSREIQIHQLKQTGVRRTFFHIQSMRVESMIVQMSIEQHKSSGFLILCLGTQNKQSPKKSEVVCYLLDPKLEFEVIKSYRWAWPEEQITSVYYKGGCGLILSSFSGFMEIFDAVNVNVSVWDNCRGHKKEGQKSISGGSISTVSYSEALDIISYGGVSGKIYILDQTTKKPKGIIDAHKHEIIMLKFYDKQHQLISVSQAGEVGLWDAQKLTEIQKIKNSGRMTQKIISTCSFYPPKGRVLMATTTIFNYDLEVDRDAKIHTEQQNAIARDYLRQFFNQLEYAGIIKQKMAIEEGKPQKSASKAGSRFSQRMDSGKNSRFDTKESVEREGSNLGLRAKQSGMAVGGKDGRSLRKQVPQHKSLGVSEYLQTAYNENSIKGAIPLPKEQNGSVLASQDSKLIGSLFDPVEFVLYTIDSDLMIRVWSMNTGKCRRSYLVETRDDQIAQANQAGGGPGAKDSFGMKIQRKKAQLARSCPDKKFLIVAFEGGELQLNNLNTGALIYNNANVEPIKIDFEIAHMKFFYAQTKFWIAASCWEGRVAFISRPTVSQGRNFLKFKKCKCSHSRDVVTLDINKENQLVTGSVDNVICFWNSFNGVESKKITLPEEVASVQKGLYIQHIRFPFPHIKDYLLIIINNGDCYILETQSEQFLEFNNHLGQDLDEYGGLNSNSDDDSDLLKSLDGSPRPKISEREIEIISTKSVSKRTERQTPQKQKLGADLEKSKQNSGQKKLGAAATSSAIFKNPWTLGRIANDPAIDLCDEYLLSVSEHGTGMLHTLTHSKNKGDSSLRQRTGRTSPSRRRESASRHSNAASLQVSPIKFELVGEFALPVVATSDSCNGVFQIDICIHHGIFLTSQVKGVICIFSLETCEILGVLNKGTMDIPQNMSPIPPTNTEPEPKPTKKGVVSAVSMGSSLRQSGGWPEQALRQSYVRNSKRFGSDIFKSIWQNQTQPAGMNSVNEFGGKGSRMNLLSDDSIALKQSAQAQGRGKGLRNSLAGKTAATSNQYQTLQESSQQEQVNFYARENIKSIQYLETEGVAGQDEADDTVIEVNSGKAMSKRAGNTLSQFGDSETTRLGTITK